MFQFDRRGQVAIRPYQNKERYHGDHCPHQNEDPQEEATTRAGTVHRHPLRFGLAFLLVCHFLGHLPTFSNISPHHVQNPYTRRFIIYWSNVVTVRNKGNSFQINLAFIFCGLFRPFGINFIYLHKWDCILWYMGIDRNWKFPQRQTSKNSCDIRDGILWYCLMKLSLLG